MVIVFKASFNANNECEAQVLMEQALRNELNLEQRDRLNWDEFLYVPGVCKPLPEDESEKMYAIIELSDHSDIMRELSKRYKANHPECKGYFAYCNW